MQQQLSIQNILSRDWKSTKERAALRISDSMFLGVTGFGNYLFIDCEYFLFIIL